MIYPIRHYSPDIRANHRPGCWKQLPLPVPHCWQYRRRLESIATVRIMIADPSLEVCVPRHLSRLWRRSAAVRQPHRVRVGTHLPTLLGLRQGQLYVAGDSDIRLSRCRKAIVQLGLGGGQFGGGAHPHAGSAHRLGAVWARERHHPAVGRGYDVLAAQNWIAQNFFSAGKTIFPPQKLDNILK